MSKAPSEFKFSLLKQNQDSITDTWESTTYWQFANLEARDLYRKNPTIEWHISERAKLFFNQGLKPDQFQSLDPNRGQGFLILLEFVRTDRGKLGGLIELVPICNAGDNLPGTTDTGEKFISNGIDMLVTTRDPLGGQTGGCHQTAKYRILKADEHTDSSRHAYTISTTGGGGAFIGLHDLIGEYRINSGILNIETFPLNPLFKMYYCNQETQEVPGSAFWFTRKLPEEISSPLLEFLLQVFLLKENQQRKVTSDYRQTEVGKASAEKIKSWKLMTLSEKKLGLQTRLIDFSKRKNKILKQCEYSVADLLQSSQQQGLLLDVNFKDSSARNALSYALEANGAEVTVEALIQAEADLFMPDDSKKTPVNYDINGLGFLVIGQLINNEPLHTKWQELLIEYIKAKLETIDIDQQAPHTLESLILKMINSYPKLLNTSCVSVFINFVDPTGATFLSYALKNQSVSELTVVKLLQAEANLFILDKSKKTPADYDIHNLGLSAICKLLRNQLHVEKWQGILNEYMDVRMKTLDMDQPNPKTGEPLIFTMLALYPELLSTKYASIYASYTDKSNRTALSYALVNNHTISTIAMLIRAGANLLILDESKKMPVNYDINGLGFSAICQMINREPQNKNWQEILNVYLKAKLETIDIDQQAPATLESLLLKMFNSYPQLPSAPCLSLFLNFKDQFDCTLLYYILKNPSVVGSTVEALILAGANLLIRNKNGKTPIDNDLKDLGLAAICKILRTTSNSEKWLNILSEYMKVRMEVTDFGQLNPITGAPLIFTMINSYPELLATTCTSRYVDLPHKSGRTFLSYALENKSTTELTIINLILAGANFLTPDERGMKPIDYDINGLGHSAIYKILTKDPSNKKWQDLLSIYLEMKLKTIVMEQLNPKTATPLFFPIIDSYRFLLSNQCTSLNVNFPDQLGRTLLSYVLKNSITSTPIIEVLIRAGADLSLPDKDGNTPVHYDIDEEGLAVICRMLRNEPSNKQWLSLLNVYMDVKIKTFDINKLDPKTGAPLILTMIAAYPELLSTKYASLFINFRYKPSGRSLLSYALENKNTLQSTVTAFIRAEADLFTLDDFKKTPVDYDINSLSLAVICKMFNDEPQNKTRQEYLSLYVKKTLKVETINIDQLDRQAGYACSYLNFKDPHGRTLLSYALENKNTKRSTIKALIRSAADLFIPDHAGNTPIFYDINDLGLSVICKMLRNDPHNETWQKLLNAYMEARLKILDFSQLSPSTGEPLIFKMMDSYPELLSIPCASQYVDFKHKSGRTFLSYALETKSTTEATVSALIKAGANLFLADDSKMMPVNYDISGLGFIVICKIFKNEPKNALPLFKAYMKTRLGVETTNFGKEDPKTGEPLIFTLVDSYPELLSSTFTYVLPLCPDDYEDKNGNNPLERFLIKKTFHEKDAEVFFCLINKYSYLCKWQEISPPFRIFINDRLINEAQDGKFDSLDQKEFDVNHQNSQTGLTLLHYAIKYSKLDVVELLLKKGANPYRQGLAEKTPYESASKEIRNFIDRCQEKLKISSTSYSLFSSSMSQNPEPLVSTQLTY